MSNSKVFATQDAWTAHQPDSYTTHKDKIQFMYNSYLLSVQSSFFNALACLTYN